MPRNLLVCGSGHQDVHLVVEVHQMHGTRYIAAPRRTARIGTSQSATTTLDSCVFYKQYLPPESRHQSEHCSSWRERPPGTGRERRLRALVGVAHATVRITDSIDVGSWAAQNAARPDADPDRNSQVGTTLRPMRVCATTRTPSLGGPALRTGKGAEMLQWPVPPGVLVPQPPSRPGET